MIIYVIRLFRIQGTIDSLIFQHMSSFRLCCGPQGAFCRCPRATDGLTDNIRSMNKIHTHGRWPNVKMAPRKRFKQCKRTFRICAPGVSKVKKVLYRVETVSRSSHLESNPESEVGPARTLNAEGEGNNNSLGQHGLNATAQDELHQSTADHGVQVSKRDGLTQYARRKLREEDAWEDTREKLKSTHFKQQLLQNSPCVVCLETTTTPKKAVCRCLDCGWNQMLCIDCATLLHSGSNAFHMLELWKVRKAFFKIYRPNS